MLRATVLIPTHSHGPLLRLAAESALAQTVGDLEVFIVLDGADSATTEVAEDVARRDPRVRLFPHEKGERLGEAYRHLALEQARGRIVCYLSDDDLWFPDHVEYLDGLLGDADFAHSLTVVARVGGGLHIPHLGDLADRWYREWLQGPANFIPLSAAGHTLQAYRSLVVGWSPAPADVWTDLSMWRKFIAAPGLCLVSGGRPTVLHFPSSSRLDMHLAGRLAELQSWQTKLQAPGAWEALRVEATDRLAARASDLQHGVVDLDAELVRLRAELAEAHHTTVVLQAVHDADEVRLAELDRFTTQLAEARHATAALQAVRHADEVRLAESETRIEDLGEELAAIRGSITYRAGRRLADLPVIGRIGRWAGRALAGRRVR
jgi:hypothetical protein